MLENLWVERRNLLLQAGSLVLSGCGGGSPVISIPAAPVCLSSLVPAYFYKPAPWEALAATRQSTVVIANASNGPGNRHDAQYQAWIDGVRSAGHRVKGYVYTRYGQRAATTVLADMDAWAQLYGVSDFFLDEVSATLSDVPYYRSLLASAIAITPARRFMLNPGTAPDAAYFSLLPDIEVLVFENAWSSRNGSSLPATLDAVASQCWLMALSATEADMLQVAAMAKSRRFAGFFATNLPYTAGLPAYWETHKALAVCS